MLFDFNAAPYSSSSRSLASSAYLTVKCGIGVTREAFGKGISKDLVMGLYFQGGKV